MIDFIGGPKRINYKILLPSTCKSPKKIFDYLQSYAGVLLVIVLEAKLVFILNVFTIIHSMHGILTHSHSTRLHTGQTCYPFHPFLLALLRGDFQINGLIRRKCLSLAACILSF